MKILVIDDDAELVRLAQLSLGRFGGFDVVTATDGASGLREAEAQAPDAILLDMVMPQMDGAAVLDALRANAKTRDIPVAFLSAKKTALENASAMRNRGVIGAIAKPFDVKSLPDELSSLLTEYERAAVDEISESFRRATAVRLRDADQALRTLEENEHDREALATLVDVFHKLAGSAGTFGYPVVSAAAIDAEEECDRTIEESRGAGALLRKWQSVLETTREQLFGAERGEERRTELNATTVFVAAPPNPQLVEAIDLLRAAGFVVEVFESTEEAAKAFQTMVPEVLITGRSFELIDQLRFARHGTRSAVIIIGGERARLPDSLQAVQRDVDAILSLPIDAASIVGMVRMFAERKQALTPHILCAGFDAEVAEVIAAIVESAGYRFRISASPKQLDADIDALDPDLIIAGPNCGGISGDDLTRHIHLVRHRGTLPVILAGTDALESARCGADAHLDLPLSPPLLLTTIATCIDRSRSIRFLVSRDPITGTLTERAFAARASRALREARTSFALVALELPEKSDENDLVALATLLRNRLRATDVIAASSARELLVLLEAIDEVNATALFNRLALEFAEERGVSVVFGVAASASVGTFDGWRTRAQTARSRNA